VAADLVPKLGDLAGMIFHGALIYNLTRKPTGEYTITSYRKTVLIYNPRAGRFGRNGGALVERVVKILTHNGHQVTVAPTTGPATAGAIARQHIAEGASLIVVAGGDGTINEAAEGVVHTEVPLAVLPGGTANVLAMETKLGKRMELAAARLEECRPCRISVGHLTCAPGVSRHFLLMAGIGLDAHIVRHVNPGLKARTGKFAYWVAGWSLLGRKLAQLDVEIDGRGYGQCSFALASKVRNYGGDYEIAREVTLFDDCVEVVLFEGRSSVPYVKYFAGMALNRLKGMKGVTVLRGRHLKLRPHGDDEPAWVQIDGELGGYLPAEIRIVPDSLTLLVPPGYGK
jgi:diacylglycerol kinase family enzyme